VAAQRPVVEKIESVDTLTNKIEELATKRLRPIEMLLQLVGENYERQPADIWFTRVSAEAGRGLNTIFVEGRTTNAAQVNAYEAALRKLPSVEKVEAPLQALRGDQAQFTLTATFKAEALAGPAAAGETPKPQP
jgi:Tfp pilus assembly protein PilN